MKGWRGERREKEKMKKEGGKATMRKLLARMRIMRDREWENTNFDEVVTAKENTLNKTHLMKRIQDENQNILSRLLHVRI